MTKITPALQVVRAAPPNTGMNPTHSAIAPRAGYADRWAATVTNFLDESHANS